MQFLKMDFEAFPQAIVAVSLCRDELRRLPIDI